MGSFQAYKSIYKKKLMLVMSIDYEEVQALADIMYNLYVFDQVHGNGIVKQEAN
jgi:hypothetical protein